MGEHVFLRSARAPRGGVHGVDGCMSTRSNTHVGCVEHRALVAGDNADCAAVYGCARCLAQCARASRVCAWDRRVYVYAQQ